MSEETWREKYYPLEAIRLKALCDVTMVKHSLQKWEGLREDSLKEHGLGHPPIRTNIDTCVLCQVYYPHGEEDGEDDERPCTNCPLFIQLGRRCDVAGAPYNVYKRSVPGSEKAMIEALKETLERLENQAHE